MARRDAKFKPVEVEEKPKDILKADGSTIVVKKDALTLTQLFTVLRPYFWPHRGTNGAWWNRLRAISTYFMISLSKISSVMAPFYLIKVNIHSLVLVISYVCYVFT